MTPRDWPIARKFTIGTLGITLAGIAFVSVFLILSEQRVVRRERVANSQALLGMAASNAAAPLVFDDQVVARQILAAMTADPTTRAASLYGADGKLFVSFSPDGKDDGVPPLAQPAAAGFSEDHLDLFADVSSNGKKVGSAFMRTDLTAMRQRFRGYVMTVVGCSAVAILLVLLLARVLQHWITRPLLSLSATASAITAQSNYAIRARKTGADEVGQLVDAFNRMVTEVEVSQQKIRSHADTLEREVADRTAELRETVEDLETFSYSVSHDLKAPLRAIHGFAEIVLETPAGVDTGPHLRRIVRGAERMDRLITDVLDYTRIAKANLKVAAVDLDELVDDVLSEHSQFTGGAVKIVVQKPLGRVLAHNAALTQVIYNLIANAVKFVAAGKTPTVTISSEQRGPNRRVYVADNGIGIGEADLQRLFRVFGRVGGSEGFDGSGIGLSIVKRAVEKMNGEVGVTSTLGQGSTFWIQLPDQPD